MPEYSDKDLLLNGDILIPCVNMFSVPSRSSYRNSHGFQRKHMNIIDPLRPTNNLGRSVNQGNFFRIRRAFSYGARNLAQILLQPEDSIASELHKFFSDTMSWHGGGLRHDFQVSNPWLTCNRPISSMPVVNYVGNRDSASNIHKYDASLAKSLNHVRGIETPESSNSLIDLSGDYSSYVQWFRRGREHCEPAVSSHSMRMTCSPTTSNQNNNPRDNVLPPPNFMQNMLPHQLFHPSSAAPPKQPTRTPCVPFEWREMHYLLENQLLESYRSPRGENQVPLQSSNSSLHANYSSVQPEGATEYGLVGNVSGMQAPVNSRQQRVASSFPSTSSRAQRSQLAQSSEQDSTRSRPAYQLKDEDDFPPL